IDLRYPHPFPTRRSSDLTQPSPQPFLFQNLDADVINTGVEVTLNIAAIATENLGLDFNLNYSYNDNIVENYNGILPTGNIRGQRSEEHTSELQSRENLVC